MLTKKQKSNIKKEYKKTWHAYVITSNKKMKENLKDFLNGQENIILQTEITRNELVVWRNEVMKERNTNLYYLYKNLNDTINEIAEKNILFEYEFIPKNIYNIVENYDYDVKRYGKLKNQLHLIEKRVEEDAQIRTQLEQKLKNMIA